MICPKKCHFHNVHSPAKDGNVKCVEYQINEHADLDKVVDGTTAMFEVVESGNLEILSLLVENGATNEYAADIDSLDADGETKLQKAVKTGILEKVQLLVLLGANVNKKSGSGETALKMASGQAENMSLYLVSAGATESGVCPCSNGNAVFEVACPVFENGDSEVVVTDFCESCDGGYMVVFGIFSKLL